MAAVTNYIIKLVDASGTGDGPYTATIYKNPTLISDPVTPGVDGAISPTAPSVTTGPLGSSGQADAKESNGAGDLVGFKSVTTALQKAILFIENDKALNNT